MSLRRRKGEEEIRKIWQFGRFFTSRMYYLSPAAVSLVTGSCEDNPTSYYSKHLRQTGRIPPLRTLEKKEREIKEKKKEVSTGTRNEKKRERGRELRKITLDLSIVIITGKLHSGVAGRWLRCYFLLDKQGSVKRAPSPSFFSPFLPFYFLDS